MILAQPQAARARLVVVEALLARGVDDVQVDVVRVGLPVERDAQGIEAARARGWQVVVSDHHLPGPRLPAADAIVNPNLPGDAFPSKALAGVGVVFYLLLALRRRLFGDRPDRAEQAATPPDRASPEQRQAPDLASLLDLVAVDVRVAVDEVAFAVDGAHRLQPADL